MDSKLSSDNYADYFLDMNQTIAKDGEYTCYLCNATYEKDLQLAAELGKTLLERNKELETALKNHQNIIEDRSQEIEYLTKQTAALKEVNTSRIKIYEQLEISIQDLEHANHTLTHQNLTDKKQIKSLLETIESLESRCEELQNSFDEVRSKLDYEKRLRISKDSTETNSHAKPNTRLTNGDNFTANLEHFIDHCTNCAKISTQLQELKSTSVKEQKSTEDLREQVSLLLQENNYLRDQVDTLQHKDEEIKSIQEELATLEQIRLGNLCKRCLRSIIPTEDCSSADELSLVITHEEQEMAESIATAFFTDTSSPSLEVPVDNPYRMLVEKYEALLKMQEQQQQWLQHKLEAGSVSKIKPCMSLRDELQLSGNYYDNDKKYQTDSEIEDENESLEQHKKNQRLLLNNPTVSSKSASSSPGSEDIRHKGTQTEVSAVLPGSFLCKISDGSDCQFSIYDDASPVESRFRKTPEYRHLFKEIFAVLKRAAEAKDEGESLPLLDDRLPLAMLQSEVYQEPKVPPVTPCKEEIPLYSDKEIVEDTLTVSTAVESAPAEKKETALIEHVQADSTENESKPVTAEIEQTRSDVMEQLMEGIKANACAKRQNAIRCDKKGLASIHRASPSPSPSHSRSTSGKRRAGSKARKKREGMTDSPNRSRERHQQRSNKPVETSASNLEMFEKLASERRTLAETSRRERPVSMFAFSTGNSSASKEVAKLKILEKSYAEVLRMGRNKNATKIGF